MDTLLKDVEYALRTLRKHSGFAAVVIVTIGLGIGACTAIFSIVNAVLLRPLPYANPERLVLVWTELRARNVMDFPFPIPDVRDLRQEAKTFEGIAGLFPPGRATVLDDRGQPEQIRTQAATPNLLSVLGARMHLGRTFTEEDGTPIAPPPQGQGGNFQPPPVVSILTYPYWQRKYGGDPGIVGRMVDFGGGGRALIVGVLQPDFELLMPPRTGIDPAVDMWTALRLNFDTAARNTGALRVVGRLKPGVTLEQAQTEAEAIATTLRDRYPVKKTADVHFRVVPMHQDLVQDVRTSILALFAAVVFVLLIACANVANLIVVRSAARRRELVIRAAIGGSRARLMRQLLTETGVLSGGGALVGLALAFLGIRMLLAMAPERLPRIQSIGIDPGVLAFTALAAVLTSIVCGVIPALGASRPDIADALRTAGAPGLRAGRSLQSGVVVAEVALSFVLLVGAGLMLRSFVALQKIDPGYEPTHVLTFLLQPQHPTPEARAAFLQQVQDRLRAVPGVEGVGAATPVPLDGRTQNIPWATEAGAADPSAFRQANTHTVRPGYFEAMKTRVVSGRTFTREDEAQAAPMVVIDEMLAARAFPDGHAVGRMLLVRNLRPAGPTAPQNMRVEVIGVVAHQRHESLLSAGREAIFFPEHSFGPGAANRWVVRATGDPAGIAQAVRAAVAEVDSRVPLAELQPMSVFVDKSLAPTRFAMALIGMFAAVAVVLAVVGLYGVLSTIVRHRTAEIGMRVVFGASQRSILGLIVGQGLKLSGAGIVVGLAAAFAVTGLMRSMLIAVTPTDPVTFATITVGFLAIAAAACWLPAWRAAHLDPVVAVRGE